MSFPSRKIQLCGKSRRKRLSCTFLNQASAIKLFCVPGQDLANDMYQGKFWVAYLDPGVIRLNL